MNLLILKQEHFRDKDNLNIKSKTIFLFTLGIYNCDSKFCKLQYHDSYCSTPQATFITYQLCRYFVTLSSYIELCFSRYEFSAFRLFLVLPFSFVNFHFQGIGKKVLPYYITLIHYDTERCTSNLTLKYIPFLIHETC